MVSFKLPQKQDVEYLRVARPLWAKLFFSRRRMFKCVPTGDLILVRPELIDEAEMRSRQARAAQFILQSRQA
ncbi:hypothetical protein EC845_0017 [Comamonas sp. BIGb0124]|uniref:hypothetical protein n=1 Tax=Comamonas sp. BIGb0124 TaxID=2485130 RepID=UPI000F45FA47|nr:hypothetical protein [Comamonas sp. BIGb0124]ROR26459.1 hypothetical protein EC845_0017 [Comamonas sp. BIGb0124]